MNQNEAIQFVNETLAEGDYGYALRAFVRANSWDDILLKNMENIRFENMTDFNYSRCFSYMFIEDIGLEKGFFTKESTKVIVERGYIEFISLKISAISPFCYIDRAKYQANGDSLDIADLEAFGNSALEKKYIELKQTLADNNLLLVEPDELNIHLENVPLENVEPEDVTYGRYLFE